jgi:hypothetical protein
LLILAKKKRKIVPPAHTSVLYQNLWGHAVAQLVEALRYKQHCNGIALPLPYQNLLAIQQVINSTIQTTILSTNTIVKTSLGL